jgi:hypothetical protein
MKNGLLIICTILALTCVCQAKDELAPTKNSIQGSGLGTIIVYRQWSFSGAGRPSWKFSVDNGPDLVVRNGTYLRVDVAPGDHVLDHKHEFSSASTLRRCALKREKQSIFNMWARWRCL